MKKTVISFFLASVLALTAAACIGGTFDIIRTSYHVELGTKPEFDPEKIDEYETKETHFTFINTDNGWRASEFADIR